MWGSADSAARGLLGVAAGAGTSQPLGALSNVANLCRFRHTGRIDLPIPPTCRSGSNSQAEIERTWQLEEPTEHE